MVMGQVVKSMDAKCSIREEVSIHGRLHMLFFYVTNQM